MCPLVISDNCTTYDNAEQALDNAISLLMSILSLNSFDHPNSSYKYKLMKRDIPYYIRETSKPENLVLLNFNYNPLGCESNELPASYSFDDFPSISIKLSAEQLVFINSLSNNGNYIIHEFMDDYPTSSRASALCCLVGLLNLKSFLFNNQIDKNAINDYIDLEKYRRPIHNYEVVSIDDIKI